MSVLENFDLVFEPAQAFNVLHATGTYFYDPDEPNDGELLITARNSSGNWVSVVMQVDDGGNTIWDSGNFDPNETREWGTLAAPYVNHTIKIFRWTPDAIGIPGDGGGDIKFTMPLQGSVAIDVTVVNG